MVTAVFVVVVLAALGAAIALVFSNQQTGSALDILGSRAYQAARAGVEWGAFSINNSISFDFTTHTANERFCPNATGTPAYATTQTTTTTFQPPATATTLAGFTITLTCTQTVDASGGPTMFRLAAVACNQPAGDGSCPSDTNPNAGNAGYVERLIIVSF